MRQPLIVVVGSTGSGKTALSLKLATRLSGEVIAADSRTVYKEMDIGTAKPTAAEQKLVPHHGLNIVEPGEPFSAAQFKAIALQAISDISKRGNLPILAGGTGLYVDAVIYDYHFPTLGNLQRDDRLLSLGVAELQYKAEELGVSLNESDWHNPRRLIRAIETGGSPKSKKPLRNDTLVIGLCPPREELKRRVHQRILDMVESGLMQEVELLVKRYGADSEAMTGIGYRSFAKALSGEITTEQAIEETFTATMQLAKRQMTWFKRNDDIVWVDSQDEGVKLASEFIAEAV